MIYLRCISHQFAQVDRGGRLLRFSFGSWRLFSTLEPTHADALSALAPRPRKTAYNCLIVPRIRHCPTVLRDHMRMSVYAQ